MTEIIQPIVTTAIPTNEPIVTWKTRVLPQPNFFLVFLIPPDIASSQLTFSFSYLAATTLGTCLAGILIIPPVPTFLLTTSKVLKPTKMNFSPHQVDSDDCQPGRPGFEAVNLELFTKETLYLAEFHQAAQPE